MQAQVRAVEMIRDTLPGAIIVGDSTQPIYAANLYYDHDRPGGWFNAATGFGALGYGPPAAIGAALAVPDAPVVCLTGDGGFQFTLPELGAALDARGAGHLRRLEQSRLSRDRDLDARCRRRAGRRLAGAAGFLQAGRSLWHRRRTACRHRRLWRTRSSARGQPDCRTSSKSPSTEQRRCIVLPVARRWQAIAAAPLASTRCKDATTAMSRFQLSDRAKGATLRVGAAQKDIIKRMTGAVEDDGNT